MALMNGTKIHKYDKDGNLLVYRIIGFKDESGYILKGENVKGRIYESEETINSEYIKIAPDAFFEVFSSSKRMSGTLIKDVFICVKKAGDILNDKNEPALVIRQNVLSTTKGAINNMLDIYVGECITSAWGNPVDLFDFDEIGKAISIAIYVDDTQESILAAIPDKDKIQFNADLKAIKKTNTSTMVKGFCETLAELMDENNFLFNYRTIFNIMQVDFPIYIDNRSVNEEGDIILNKKQHRRLEDELRQHINITGVVKYDKDIDISKIVSFTHIMVSDKSGTIYLIAYQKIADYKVDADIAEVFHIQQ